MYGLILRVLQSHVVATFGPREWEGILGQAGLSGERFKPLLSSGPEPLRQVLAVASSRLKRPADKILEDAGTFLATSPTNPAIRQLLRFSGTTFEEFLHSLEELPDRARLALPEFDFPRLELVTLRPGEFRLRCSGGTNELLPLMRGALRAMANEYGALAVIDLPADGAEMALSIHLVATRLASGCGLDLVSAG